LTLFTWKNLILLGLILAFAVLAGMSNARAEFFFFQQRDTTKVKQDTTINKTYKPSKRPTFRQNDRYGDPFSNNTSGSPLFLKDPAKMKLDVDIDTSMNYTVFEKIGDLNYRPTTTMSFEEFKKQQDRQQLKQYWQSKSRASDGESAVSSRSLIPKIYISPVLDRIFGGSYVELVPRGFVTLDFGASFQKVNNPNIPIRQQRNGGFQFDQQVNMSVVGKIGEKLAVTANFDNNNSFDFQNNMKVEYTGFKEDVLQKLEIGNVSLPLNNTLIQGAQNLFGVKAQMQFGKLNVTAIASTQRGKVSSIDLGGSGAGGASQGKPFLIPGSGYDDNRHFFLGHFFRDNYRKWIANLPQITSGVNITRVEVYVLNRNNDTQTLRNVIGLLDLAEPTRIYNSAVTKRSTATNSNDANSLFSQIGLLFDPIKNPGSRKADGVNATLENFFAGDNNNGHDFEKITGARKLNATEYTFQKQLGYITLTRKLQNDEALAVAYEYTYNGKSYKVGELSEDYANLQDEDVIFLKLLRQRDLSVALRTPAWDLMMKNIYSLNVTQLERENFQLRVIYRDDKSGIDNPQLQEGETVRDRQLIEITGLDKLNPLNDPQPDGNFDFVEGITINSQNGLIIFPYLEPFNTALREAFAKDPQKDYLIRKYVYDTLYRSTKADAEQFATKNKFFLSGTYSATSSKEILIPGFGVSQGSVKVFAGGIPLVENVQYTVDYTFGKVTILDESILSSGKNISVQFEQADPFSFQTRSLLGTRLDYKLSDDINIGSTLLYYNERPLVSRNAVGTEPARNVQYGVDFNVNKTSRVLTKLVDALPFIQTKETSTVNVSGEFAQLLPGTSNIIDGQGTGYIDDFENTATPSSLLNTSAWKLAATPKAKEFVPSDKVPVPTQADNIHINDYRAKLAWYTIDNLFFRQGGTLKPSAINDKVYDNHYMRYVLPWEVFPKRQRTQGAFFEQVFDLAFYPAERGPYNYTTNLTSKGLLADSLKSWAGITTAIRTEVDFDKANVEYVEFWMLDPFITSENGVVDDGRTKKNNKTGGKLVFHLGNISEDVARDSKHAFENGLPPDGNLHDAKNASRNNFGYVSNQQYITNAFDNATSARKYQDVGFDGLSDEASDTNEKNTFTEFTNNVDTHVSDADAKAKLLADPSGDDFKYFLDPSLDHAKILERYKSYNGLEGNTPIISTGDRFTPSATPYPDNEDINADNTVSELEEYYSYDIDLKPGQLSIGKEYVVDKLITQDNHAKEPVTWYLFRIPIREYESSYGEINGFKSIRYARMILTGWKEPVVLRLVNFRTVASKWRQYQYNIPAAGLSKNPENAVDDFTLSTVNIEENSEADVANNKSAYKIPPGVVRDRDNSSTIFRQLNEQSVQMCLENLKDGDGRGIYKNVTVDLFNYGRVKMFFHLDSRQINQDSVVHGFLRMGTDFDQNYYEVEVPLRVSQVSSSMPTEEVWPEENNIDLDLNELYALKAERDREGKSLSEPFPADGPKKVGKYLIRIFGRPDLSDVRLMMIGAKNPRTPDRKSFSGCLWANELRVTDFNRKAGWAVNGMLSAKLADFATVNAAVRHTTFGFGSVSSKIGERTRDDKTIFDVSANVNLDKLIPGKTGIKLPMFVSYQNTTINPNYDPANPDMKLAAALKSFATDSARQGFKNLIQDKTIRRSINFTNVRKTKVKPDAKTHIYDIENLSFSYSYSDAIQTNYFIKESLQKLYHGSTAYNFAPKSTGIEPFKNINSLKSPWFKLLKEFNFNLLPSNITVRGDLDRSFSKKVYRNAPSAPGGEFQYSKPNYLKYFTFNRTYNVAWSLSKNLSVEYNSTVNTVIDEPEGEINTDENKTAVIKNLKNFGRMKNFQQAYTLNYTLPLDKLPATDYLGVEYRYQGSYNWKAGPNVKEDTTHRLPDFGNIIQNTRENNVTGKIDLVKLYNKVKFLKELNTPPKPKPPVKPGTRVKQEVDTVKSMPALVKGFLRLVMSLRSINASYTLSEGTILPGFALSPKLFGMDKDYSAPGWGFILGSQDPNIRLRAAQNGWLTKADELTNPFTQMQNKTLDIKGNMELSPDFKVQLNLRKENSNAYQEIFRYDSNADGWASLNPSRTGSYKISFISIKTAFDKTNGSKESNVFHQFEKNLDIIRDRFLQINHSINSESLDTTVQDVTVAAFLAAYTGKDAHTTKLGSFPKLPLPNWRIDYAGLSKWQMFKETFSSITVSHAYQSSYSVSNYTNSLQYTHPDTLGINVNVTDYNNNYFGRTIDGKYVPIYVLGQVFISEQFSPLIGVNVKTKGRLSMNFQYKTKRDLALNITNAQITEMNSKDVSFELGYTKNNLKLPFKVQGETIILKNDVTFRLNVSVSDNKTIQRKVHELNTVTNGNLNFQLRPNISYVVNQKLNIQAYFERTINDPKISNSFRRATTRFGVQIRFSLAQ
jgi:cell surface protein SprA